MIDLPAFKVLFVIPLLISFGHVYAANDWSTPCFDGVCQYSLTSSSGQSGSGTMKIWGSSDAITDITTAAGWEILNCSATATAQDIRLVCVGNDTTSAGCDHLYQNIGAEGKIVRLPENCGASPFARVARAYVPEDQSISANVSKRIVRRDGSTPQVKALTLDTNFTAIDPSKAGTINIAIRGANFPGADVNGTMETPTTGSKRRSRLPERGLLDFVGDAINSISQLTDFNLNKTINLPPVSVNKSATLLNTNLTCGDAKLNLDVGVDGLANAQASLGVAASGTIVPPKFDDFAVIVGLNANIDGSIDINADVGGTFDTGKIPIFSVGIPGLDIPGIFSIGPTFEVDAEATAQLDVDVDMTVGVNYQVKNAQLVFPPSKDISSGGSFNINDTPLKLSLSPGVKATGNVTAHLIPTLNLGVNALSGLASANIFLDLDASATLQLSLDASDNTNVTIAGSSNDNSTSSSVSSAHGSMMSANSNSTSSSVLSAHGSMMTANSKAASKRYVLSSTDSASGSSSAAMMHATSIPQAVSSAKMAAQSSASSMASSSLVSSNVRATATTSASKSTSSSSSSSSSSHSSSSSSSNVTSSSDTSFGGCVELDVGFNVNAGASGNLFNIFNDSTQVTLFSKEFQLFQKCFGDAATADASKRSQSRAIPRRSSLEHVRSLQKRDAVTALVCPSNDVGTAENVVDQIVKAVGITSKAAKAPALEA